MRARTKPAPAWIILRADLAYGDQAIMIERLPDRFPGLTVLDPKAAFCTPESCTVVENGVAYFRDQTHLTNEGSAFLISRMSPQLLEALKP